MDFDESLCVLVEMFDDVAVSELQDCLCRSGDNVDAAVELLLRRVQPETYQRHSPELRESGSMSQPSVQALASIAPWSSLVQMSSGRRNFSEEIKQDAHEVTAVPRTVTWPLKKTIKGQKSKGRVSDSDGGTELSPLVSPPALGPQQGHKIEESIAGLHSWAESEVVEAILAAVGGDFRAADSVLSEMSSAVAAVAFSGENGDEYRKLTRKEEENREEEEEGDLYWRHRKEAVRAGRKLRKLQKQAAQARAAGDFSMGRQYAEQAEHMGKQVAEMHREAAALIEAELNGNGEALLMKLDLHGLHVNEALEALERRLRTVEESPVKAIECRKGASRKLNVIVGRGSHSSNSEASIPRAVESYLMRRGNNFRPGRLGCLEVSVARRGRGQKHQVPA